MFSADQILYTLVPVNGLSDFEAAYLDHIEGVKYVLLINCGGSLDIVEYLQPDPEIVFYILDR